jgi:hypothetical protein
VLVANDPDLAIVNFDPLDQRTEPVLASSDIPAFEPVPHQVGERGDFLRRDSGPDGRSGGDAFLLDALEASGGSLGLVVVTGAMGAGAAMVVERC